MIKVLLLDVNVNYVNPTRNLLPYLLNKAFDVKMFGPGYVGTKTLEAGLSDYIKKNGPFDFCILTEHMIYFDRSYQAYKDKLFEIYKKKYYLSFNYQSLRNVSDIVRDFKSMKIPKVAALFESDYYNFSEDYIQILKDSVDYVMGWGDQFIRPTEELNYLKKENFNHSANNNWFNFVSKNAEKVISLPAFVSETEFSWNPIANRKELWSISGAHYWARKTAKSILKENKVKFRGKMLSILITLALKVKVPVYSNVYLLKLINLIFRNSIEYTKYSYTCGSGLSYPIRKFFEIPALGSVLVCLPCNGFKELGFKDKINALVSEPDRVMKVHDFLQNNPQKAQDIADAGRHLIWRSHTTDARAKQLAICFDAMKKNEFAGSFWKDGVFHVIQKNKRNVKVKKVIKVI